MRDLHARDVFRDGGRHDCCIGMDAREFRMRGPDPRQLTMRNGRYPGVPAVHAVSSVDFLFLLPVEQLAPWRHISAARSLSHFEKMTFDNKIFYTKKAEFLRLCFLFFFEKIYILKYIINSAGCGRRRTLLISSSSFSM